VQRGLPSVAERGHEHALDQHLHEATAAPVRQGDGGVLTDRDGTLQIED